MERALWQRLLNRQTAANKYDFGHVLVVGGSPGMVGAPLLAAMAALRVGAGLVTIASTPTVVNKLERRVREIMALRLPGFDKPAASVAVLDEFIRARKVSAIVVGPGLAPNAATFVRRFVAQSAVPLVLDAGGLAAFAGRLELFAKLPSTIITPHAGEFAKLIQSGMAQNESDRKSAALTFAKQHHVTVIFKGSPTVVAQPDGTLFRNQTGNPGMATAGTGDVLDGILAGLLAQHFSTAEASQMAVYLHGRAGDEAAKLKTQPGMIASDVIECIPTALRELK